MRRNLVGALRDLCCLGLPWNPLFFELGALHFFDVSDRPSPVQSLAGVGN